MPIWRIPDPADPAKRENPAYYRPAYLTLEQALREDPTRSDVRRKLVEVAMRTRPGDARDHLKILLDASPEDAALKEMMAQCQIANDENSAAEETLTKAIEKNPTRLESYVRLANLLRQRMDRDADADAWMNKLVEANPEAAAAYCRRGEYLRMVRKAEDADKDAAKAIELAPDDEDALLLAARCAIDKEQYDDARRHAEHAVKLFPKSVECYGVLSSIESTAGRPAVAREWLDKGLLETDEDPELLFDKARYELTAGETEKAGVIIEKLERARFPAPLLSHLRSWAEFLNGNWASASKGFEGNRPELLKLGRWAALARHGDVLASQCYERLSLPEKQKLAMERARGLGADAQRRRPGPAGEGQGAGRCRRSRRRRGRVPRRHCLRRGPGHRVAGCGHASVHQEHAFGGQGQTRLVGGGHGAGRRPRKPLPTTSRQPCFGPNCSSLRTGSRTPRSSCRIPSRNT